MQGHHAMLNTLKMAANEATPSTCNVHEIDYVPLTFRRTKKGRVFENILLLYW